MADEKLSQLTTATLPLNDNDLFYVVQNTTSTSSTSQSVKFVDLSSQINPGGGGGGGLIFVNAISVAVAVQDVNFSSLDGNTDSEYLIEYSIRNVVGSTVVYSVQPNAVATNQWTRRFAATSGGTINDTFNDLYLTGLVNNDFARGWYRFYAVQSFEGTTQRRSTQGQFVNDGATGDVTGQAIILTSGTWNENSTNLTSIRIHADTANGISIGSWFRLYKFQTA